MSHDEQMEEIVAVRERATLLHSAETVQAALDRMAIEVQARFKNENPLLLCVMTGGIMTLAWLLERLDFLLEIDYVHLTRYHGSTSASRELTWLSEPTTALTNRNVLLVDDIYDEGVTLRQLVDYCHRKGAAQVASAVLLYKHHKRNRVGNKPDIIGLEVEDHFVFGCGLDYKNHLRNLSAIYAVNHDNQQR